MAKVQQGPNPVVAGWSMLRAQLTNRRPRPSGTGTVDHAPLTPILEAMRAGGVQAVAALRPPLAAYRRQLETVTPDALSRPETLAFWLNLYNAGALDLAAEAWQLSSETVLRVRGGFTRPWATVAGESLSLDDIEHGKLRRLGDPRIHGSLVCGSASCPTLRYEPFTGDRIDGQLEAQMRRFLHDGGMVADRAAGVAMLSRVFLWYGADFVRPHRMPAWRPAGKATVLAAIVPWLEADVVRWIETDRPRIAFQPYDWTLACAVR